MMPSNRMGTCQTMKLIMNTYSGFQDLPKGIKKMLLVSESFFFDEMRQPSEQPMAAKSLELVPPTMLIPRPTTAAR